MADKSTNSSGGIGVCGLLGVVFVTLKLCHVIHWSWWWVTCPFWAPVAIVFLVLACLFAFAGVCFAIAGIIAGFGK